MINKMRFVLLFVLAVFVVSGVNADEKSKKVLDRVGQIIKTYKSYKVSFSVTSDGDFDDLQGKFVVSGPRFYIDIYDSEVFCDGKIKYTYSRQNNEVLIENLDQADNSIISNPTRIFSLYDSGFAHRYLGTKVWKNYNVDVLELTPKSGMLGNATIKLFVDQRSGLPVFVIYKMLSSQTEINIEITKFESNVPVDDSTFRFDKSRYKGVEVIDFR